MNAENIANDNTAEVACRVCRSVTVGCKGTDCVLFVERQSFQFIVSAR